MVKELKELIMDVASIDTSVDMDDIRAISTLNENIMNNIIYLRDFIGDLNIPKTVHDINLSNMTGLDSTDYPELQLMGLTAKTIDKCRTIYESRTTVGKVKMSFETMVKCCVFVHNYIVEHGDDVDDEYYIDRLSVNKPLKDYLTEIDGDKRYVAANIHDFLTGKNFSKLTQIFFECTGDAGSKLKVDGYVIRPERPF